MTNSETFRGNSPGEHYLFASEGRPWIMYPSDAEIRRFSLDLRSSQSRFLPLGTLW
jgi:hypothetical protein